MSSAKEARRLLERSFLLLVALVLLSHLGNEVLDAKSLDHVLEDLVLLDLDLLDLDLGLVWDEVHLTLSFLLLKSERDASDWTLLDALHEMGGETGNLVSKSLGLDHCNVVDDSLIYMEVAGQLAVVLLNKCSGGSLNSLGSNSAHRFIK